MLLFVSACFMAERAVWSVLQAAQLSAKERDKWLPRVAVVELGCCVITVFVFHAVGSRVNAG